MSKPADVWLVGSCLVVGVLLASGCDLDSDVRRPPRISEETPSIETPIGNKRDVRAMVRSFMERRVAGRGAERFVAAENLDDFGPRERLGQMYPKPQLEDFEIVFVDGPLGGPSYEVGVKLIFARGSY
jgi:hypothetical protein